MFTSDDVQAPVLFLDFDGVLSKGLTGDFRHRNLLEAWLRNIPDIRVVISSSWRLDRPLEAIRLHFSRDIQRRVIGATPHLPSERLQRQAEILTWREQVGHEGPFAVIDDSIELFEIAWPFVVITTRHGLEDGHLDAVLKILYPNPVMA